MTMRSLPAVPGAADVRWWPEPVDWVEPLFRRYLRALYEGPDAHRFESFSVYELEWIVGYMVPMAWFESRGNPNAVNRRVYADPMRQAAGVYQHMPVYWDGRVESTIRLLRRAGLSDVWMDDPQVSDPLPTEPGTGILHLAANVAVAAYLFGIQGPGAWSPSRTIWKPENFQPDTWLWVDGAWGRISNGQVML